MTEITNLHEKRGCLKTRHPLFSCHLCSLNFVFLSRSNKFRVFPKYSILTWRKTMNMAENAVFGGISSVFRMFCDFPCHFLDVERNGEEGKVHFDLVFSHVAEPLVVHAGLHLSEYGFRFDVPPSSVHEHLLRGKPFGGLALVFPEPVIYLYYSSIHLRLVA